MAQELAGVFNHDRQIRRLLRKSEHYLNRIVTSINVFVPLFSSQIVLKLIFYFAGFSAVLLLLLTAVNVFCHCFTGFNNLFLMLPFCLLTCHDVSATASHGLRYQEPRTVRWFSRTAPCILAQPVTFACRTQH